MIIKNSTKSKDSPKSANKFFSSHQQQKNRSAKEKEATEVESKGSKLHNQVSPIYIL